MTGKSCDNFEQFVCRHRPCKGKYKRRNSLKLRSTLLSPSKPPLFTDRFSDPHLLKLHKFIWYPQLFGYNCKTNLKKYILTSIFRHHVKLPDYIREQKGWSCFQNQEHSFSLLQRMVSTRPHCSSALWSTLCKWCLWYGNAFHFFLDYLWVKVCVLADLISNLYRHTFFTDICLIYEAKTNTLLFLTFSHAIKT